MDGSQDPREAAFSFELPAREKVKRHYNVIRPKAGQTVKALVLSDRPLITNSHYRKKVTWICVGKIHGCQFCAAGIRVMLKGYLAGADLNTGKNCLIELTENALYETPAISKSKTSLRGRICTLTRHGEADNGPVTASFSDDPSRRVHKGLRQPFDVMEALISMWEVPALVVDPETKTLVPSEEMEIFETTTEELTREVDPPQADHEIGGEG